MQTPRDDNHVPAKFGVWCEDGTTLIPIAISTVNGGMMVDEISTVSYTPTPVSPQDENFVNVLLCDGGDGNFYPINVNSSGAVLIEN